jgi:hypothetical protein
MAGNIQERAPRGSEWHRWEPHIHAPGTAIEDQYPEKNAWELYLRALEEATPSLRAIVSQIIVSLDPMNV